MALADSKENGRWGGRGGIRDSPNVRVRNLTSSIELDVEFCRVDESRWKRELLFPEKTRWNLKNETSEMELRIEVESCKESPSASRKSCGYRSCSRERKPRKRKRRSKSELPSHTTAEKREEVGGKEEWARKRVLGCHSVDS